ncbi:recombinase family protein [Streptomyces daghestanicus]|uniref:Integrase n=1 Tax=Streptomyces daghestanicus TaxID=66885 RepID=A0ABQ3PVR1_9ACTN|nr:recombinase family protein [Streptomyces daghestanicus]GHI29111.1 integrase [Streptomyces daghestanicus]
MLTAAASVGAHIIGWADDWEVSGATDPMTRPSLGPWLRDERGPYDGLVAAAVDRLGRNVVDCLNTGYKMRDEKKMLVTYGHDGAWDLDDPADENRFTMEAWGAQMELRAIQRRNRDATVKTRAAGRPKGKPSYGFRYVRTVMGGKIDHVELHPHASQVIREVARRILADPDDVTPSSEAARLNRAGELSPADHLAVMYGKPAGGRPWSPQSLKNILLSEATLGYLMHRNKPVLSREDGNPVKLCEGLWDRATHEALKTAVSNRKATWIRRSNREYLLTNVALCGQCHTRLYTQTSNDVPPRYTCTARNKGWLQSQHCRPAPLIYAHLLDAYVEEWFLRELGDGLIYETVYDPGNGIAERIAETRANRERLRADREAGLYDARTTPPGSGTGTPRWDANWPRWKPNPRGHPVWSGGLRARRSPTGGFAHRTYKPARRSCSTSVCG